ncbi:MAG: single-stranded-DNA-specific exonuclease RecJ [Oscillospiraceae bacterium]|nr:single-stranded-DNA-specific exonuclease RecJ [Oscillospiraceae bacterium]
MKKWTLGNPDRNAARILSQQGGLSGICAEVLVSRGIDSMEKAVSFFNADNNNDEDKGEMLSDPFLVKDMREAADTILAAVDSGKKICVYGDYDCDGITATALLYSYIECIGGDVRYYINDRSEGYGLCADALRRLADESTELIVTVDNGISAVNEAALAKELGIELVITDHHQPGEVLPAAAAVVDPHRDDDLSPFKDLCGCGVALKLIAAMDGGSYDSALEQFSDLAAIATVADVVPLAGENREIVRLGLRYLENTENAGLQALMEAASVKLPVTSTQAAFSIAPRINASGRFASASEAVELLLCEDPDAAAEIAARLNSLNSERKKTEADIMEEIRGSILKDPHILYERVLFLYGENWHHGVIGIVAAKLVERFGKPVFILSDDGDEARGSARSVAGFSVHKALTACSEVLTKFGGHSGAGGFSLKKENIGAFNEALQKYAAEEFTVMPRLALHADKLIRPEELTVEEISSLGLLEPCGEGNPKPMFALLGARLDEVVPLSGGAHTRLKLAYGNKAVLGLMFGTKTAEFPYRTGDVLDILAHPEINTYGGQSSVNLHIEDCRRNGVPQKKYFAALDAYERCKRGEGADKTLAPRIVPDRNGLAAVYRAIPETAVGMDSVFSALYLKLGDDMNYCRFRLSLDIFAETGLAEIDLYSETVRRLPAEKKINLDDSVLLTELRSLLQ